MIRWFDCNCEDFPCCGHYDTIADEPEYCDTCGINHRGDCRPDDDDETDDEDVIAMRDPEREHDQDHAYAVQGVIDAHAEYDRETPWAIDYDRGEEY